MRQKGQFAHEIVGETSPATMRINNSRSDAPRVKRIMGLCAMPDNRRTQLDHLLCDIGVMIE